MASTHKIYRRCCELEEYFDYLIVFVLAAVPVIELKGAIPVGLSRGIPQIECFIIAVAGSMLFCPLIIILTRRVLEWCMRSNVALIHRFGHWQHNRVLRRGGKIEKYREWMLFIFVAIPLPTTGVWTGSMIAGLFDIRLRSAFPVIFLGNCVAGALIWLIWGFTAA